MNPFAALAVKAIGGGTAAALLSLGVAGGLAQAASPNPSPTPATSANPTKPDPHKDQFAARLAVSVKPRLETLVDKKEITQAQADKALDRISKGDIPFWNGIHPRKATSA